MICKSFQPIFFLLKVEHRTHVKPFILIFKSGYFEFDGQNISKNFGTGHV